MLEALSGSAQASALDLSQNGIGHFGTPRQYARLYHVSTLMVGRLWGFVGVDTLKISTETTPNHKILPKTRRWPEIFKEFTKKRKKVLSNRQDDPQETGDRLHVGLHGYSRVNQDCI